MHKLFEPQREMLLYNKPAKSEDHIESKTAGERPSCCLIFPYRVCVSLLLSTVFLQGPPPPSSISHYCCSCLSQLASATNCIQVAQARAQKTGCMNCSFSIIGARRPIAFRYVMISSVCRVALYLFSTRSYFSGIDRCSKSLSANLAQCTNDHRDFST
jgi:hypothetical protein